MLGLLEVSTASWHTASVTTAGSTSTNATISVALVEDHRLFAHSVESSRQAVVRELFDNAISASGMRQRALRNLAADELTDHFVVANMVVHDQRPTVVIREVEWSSSYPPVRFRWQQWLDGLPSASRSALTQCADSNLLLDVESIRTRTGFDRFLRALQQMVDLAAAANPYFRLVQLLERMWRLNRRADMSRQSAAQRLLLARQSIVSTPDCPPGELVLSSARVPRGPDASQVTAVFAGSGPCGRQLAPS